MKFSYVIAGAALLAASNAFAGLVTFSDRPAGEDAVPASYTSPVGMPAGVTVTITDAFTASGELPDHTGDSAAIYMFPGTEAVDLVMSFSAPVEVSSAFTLRDDWSNEITFTGLLGGSTVWTSPTVSDFNTWVEITAGAGQAIDSLRITGLYARVDDITINAVPEPASIGLLGLAGLGLLKRRR